MSLERWLVERLWGTLAAILIFGVSLLALIMVRLFGYFSVSYYAVGITVWAFLFLGFFGWNSLCYHKDTRSSLIDPFTNLEDYLQSSRDARLIRVGETTGIQEVDRCLTQMASLSSEWAIKHESLMEKEQAEAYVANFLERLGEVVTQEDVAEKLRVLFTAIFHSVNGTLLGIMEGNLQPLATWGLAGGNIAISCPALSSKSHLSQSEVYQQDGCTSCRLTDPRQSSCCYTFTRGSKPLLLLHLGSTTERAFGQNTLQLLDRVQDALQKHFSRLDMQQAMESKAYTDALTGL